MLLEFTPLEFETKVLWSVFYPSYIRLEFTPLEFETGIDAPELKQPFGLEFTPLEFETCGVARS